MNKVQKKQIGLLLKEISKQGSTEATIAFIAESSGMLHSCSVFLNEYRKQDPNLSCGFNNYVKKYKMPQSSLFEEITGLVRLFAQQVTTDTPHEILGVTLDATQEEIKRAYRKLSIKYHPDTSSSNNSGNTEKFIEITKAYHKLTGDTANITPINSGNVKETGDQRKKGSSMDNNVKNLYLVNRNSHYYDYR